MVFASIASSLLAFVAAVFALADSITGTIIAATIAGIFSIVNTVLLRRKERRDDRQFEHLKKLTNDRRVMVSRGEGRVFDIDEVSAPGQKEKEGETW